jgi:hypothetical protein
MAQQQRQTFEQILFAAAPQNARVLEEKAHTASMLARTYPENAFLFRAIEGRLVDQLLKILPGLGSDQESAMVPSYEVEEKEVSLAVG